MDTFRQAKAPSEKRKAVLRSASKEAKPEAVAAAHQASSEAGKLPAPKHGARCSALGVCAACLEEAAPRLSGPEMQAARLWTSGRRCGSSI